MRHHTFLTWLSRQLLGFVLVAGSMQAIVVAGPGWLHVVLPCALAALAGLAIVIWAELKERPHRLIRKARKSLMLPTQWSVKFGKRMADGSEVAVAVIRADGVRFVIDIRDDPGIRWGTPVDGTGQPRLVGERGKPLKPDPIAPLTKAAFKAGAAPVLWLPRAKTTGNLRHPDSNLIVVMGSASDLKHALQSAQIVPTRAPADVADKTPPTVEAPDKQAVAA